MRSTQKSNRTRGRGNRKSNGNNLNRVYDSSGPEGKVRGTPQQIIDKYLSLARDAQTSGDRVMAENFLQHAEHYQRILLLATASQQEQRRDAPQSEDEEERSEAAAEDRPRRRPEPDGAPGEGPQPEIEDHTVGGLTTIDPEDSPSESLLVATEETGSAPAPRRRRSRTAKPAETAPAASETPPSEPADAGPEAG
ncbi:MAG: DUF4167 domain-containing protein [Pseudomonadota bacterium]